MASVKVAVRVRPMNRREKDLNAKFIISMEKNKTTITNLKVPEGATGDTGRERTKTFTYDFSYFSADSKSPSFVCQEMVFKNLGTDVLKSAFEGYNACVFAYGQTGSGKSYTMMGNAGDAGLIPRICEGLFSQISEKTKRNEASFRTEVSYLEIYNERVRDLLRRKSSKTNNLRIREHPKEGPYVEDLSKHLVQNYTDVEELMEAGNINRTTAATGMNDVSSRSHAIFTINFTQAKFDSEMPCETVSKIHLVDLAGSERADATGATGVRLKEGGNINKSLVTLGNVISALAISPADVNYGETLSTLRYANRAKNIINKPTINEDPNVKLIRELRAEIARLKALLAQGNQIALLDSPTALSMEEKLQQNEARVQELTKEWTNKWNETQDILKEQTLALRKEGIGVVLDSELPHLIGIDDDLLSTGIILYHLKEGQTYVGREDAMTEQDIVLHGLDLESEHCIFENLNGTVNLIPLNGAQCSVNGIQITEPTHLNQGAVILLGRTNMFRFNHPKEAAKLREKRKSGLLSSFSLSMTDLSKSCENLSAVMLYNPGLEFERQQREELEKLESKRKQIEEMEEKQRSDKAELVRMQQEVESQRKETEIVQLQIRKQEESLKRRSVHIESRLKDLLAEKEKFEEERLREQQEIELQKKKHQEEIFARVKEELQRLQELNHNEKAEKMQIFRELERLKKEKDEQYVKLESEKKRLEEQEREQVMLVAHLEEQLREKQVMIELLKRGDVQRVEEERRDLEDIRESLLKVKEARSEGDENNEELEKAQHDFVEFKRKQLEQLTILEKDLVQQIDHLEKEIADEKGALEHLKFAHEEHLNPKREDEHSVDPILKAEEADKIKPVEYRLQSKVRQLEYLKSNHLPALLEEKQRASEILDRGLLGLDNTLYQIEKEIEEKEEKLAQYRASTNQLQQLQETFEFTANVARQEEKVRKKEKEILESREKQQREALEQAVAKLERRHSALQRRSTIDFEIEEQRQKLATLNNNCSEQAGLQASLEAQQKALEQDRERLDQEIQQLKQKIYEGDGAQKGNHGTLEERLSHSTSPSSPAKPQPPSAPLVDDRINAFIEQEVQRRLQNIHHKAEDNDVSVAWSTESLKDNERLNNGTVQRKLKYESNMHSETKTYKENRPLNTAHPAIEDQSSNSQLPTQKAFDLIPFKSIASHFGVRPEHTSSLGSLVSKLSCLYKNTSSQLLNSAVVSKQMKELGSLCDRSERCAQTVSLIKNLPFIRNLQVNVFFKSDVNQDMSHTTDDAKAHTENIIQPESPMQEAVTACVSTEISDACTRKTPEGFTCWSKKEELENSFVLRQNFVHFPDVFLKLQVFSLEKVLEFLTCALPQISVRMEELKGIYWLAVGNCKKPDPEPACLLLFNSILYVVVSSAEQDTCQSSLALLYEVRIDSLKEIQVGFAGQNIRLLCSAEGGLLTIFTYNKHFTQRICHDIVSILISAADDDAYLNHQLLKGDLIQISLDWTSDVNDLVFSSGVRLSCKFQTELADLVYLLHENMGSIKPPLGDIHVLLYTSVKVDSAEQTVYRTLVLTTTHIGLLKENHALNIQDASCWRSQFDTLQLYSLNDIRCAVLPDKENCTKIELVFSRRSKVGSDSGTGFSKYCEEEINTQLTVIPSILQSSLHIPSEIWKLTFSSSEEAIWLIMHLTRC
ncbi:Kinesin-like protein KIF16B [Pitangus sulphuratus]|nr:Kinesin-like protein KIF16B [Pitangus sulphuratus]